MKIKMFEDSNVKTTVNENNIDDVILETDERFIDLLLDDGKNLNVNFNNVEKLNVKASERIVNQLGEKVDYVYDVENKPSVNGITLVGNKTSHDIKVQDEMNIITEQDIDNMIYGG